MRNLVQAIQTRYIGPTNRRGSRVKAIAAAGSLTVGWRDELGSNENHEIAAQLLAFKYGWATDEIWNVHWRGGVLKDGSYVWVDTSP